MTESPIYMIYAPPFSVDSGGAIFLHRLVHEVRKLGEEAYLFPLKPNPPRGRRAMLKRAIPKVLRPRGPAPEPFVTSPDLDTPVWSDEPLPDNVIALYTEMHEGNPLRARHVARWLLYKPGHLGRPTDFPRDNLFFAAGAFSDDPKITGGAQPLQLFSVNPIYRDMGLKTRSGSCYMVRKARDREDFKLVHPMENSRLVDYWSHEDLVQVFNECETFYCYDDATMYSQYAALCGCDSIVIPWHFETRAEWNADRPLTKYGVGHGLDDVEHSRKTRHLLREALAEREAAGLESVRNFVRSCRQRFGFAEPDF